MKRFSSRTVAAITNCVLILVLALVSAVCFIPASSKVSTVRKEAYSRGNSKDGVSLMFNVYWGAEELEQILSVLKEEDAAATFFVGGSWADDHPALLKKIAEEGHELASHGYFHRDHSKLDYKGNLQEIKASTDYIFQAAGVRVALFAPPSGAYNSSTVEAASALGLKTILWSKDTIDWRDKDENVCFTRATQNVKGGEFILMHPMAHTLKALPAILKFYRESGLMAITVSENLQ